MTRRQNGRREERSKSWILNKVMKKSKEVLFAHCIYSSTLSRVTVAVCQQYINTPAAHTRHTTKSARALDCNAAFRGQNTVVTRCHVMATKTHADVKAKNEKRKRYILHA
jgi:hypothetical protein